MVGRNGAALVFCATLNWRAPLNRRNAYDAVIMLSVLHGAEFWPIKMS